MELWEVFLGATLRIGTPLLLAALGELILERAGVLNIGLEGVLIGGAFAGFLAGWASGSPWAGAAASMLAGMLLCLLLGWMVLRLRANQIVVGMALNLVAFGVSGTAYLAFQQALHRQGAAGRLSAPVFGPLFPGGADWPWVGTLLLSQSILTWAALLLVPLLWFYLERSERGMGLRAVGENPAAAEASGIPAVTCRMKACLAAGLLGGLGGGFLTLSQASSFSEKCSAGRGFVALAAVVLGRYGAWGTAAACLFFGAAFAARDQFQAAGWRLAPEVLELLPYLLTLVALALFFQRRTGAPAALGRPYHGPGG